MKVNLVGMILNTAGRSHFDGFVMDDDGKPKSAADSLHHLMMEYAKVVAGGTSSTVVTSREVAGPSAAEPSSAGPSAGAASLRLARHPTLEECHAAGVGPTYDPARGYREGGLPNDADERARFEAYMRGHCWEVGKFDESTNSYDTHFVRCMYGVWRDRGSLPTVA